MTDRLPNDVAEAMRDMHKHRDPRLVEWMAWMRRQNWTASQIAEPLGQTRQAVNARVARWLDGNEGRLPSRAPSGLPRVPYQRPRPKVSAVRTFTLPVDRAAYLAGLWMMSSRVRNRTPKDHPSRKASALFDQHLIDLLQQGYTINQIAHDIGVEGRIIRLRMQRHGLSVAAIARGGAA